MGDKRRFDLFANYIKVHFPKVLREVNREEAEIILKESMNMKGEA